MASDWESCPAVECYPDKLSGQTRGQIDAVRSQIEKVQPEGIIWLRQPQYMSPYV